MLNNLTGLSGCGLIALLKQQNEYKPMSDFKRISIEIFPENAHKDFDSYHEFEDYIDSNDLDWLDCDTINTIRELDFMLSNSVESTTFPIDESKDLHIHIEY